MAFQMPQINDNIGNALANIGQIRQQRTQNALADRQVGLQEAQGRRAEAEFNAAQQAAQRARVEAQMKNLAMAIYRVPEKLRAQQLQMLRGDPRFADLPQQAWSWVDNNPQALTTQNLTTFLNAGGDVTPEQRIAELRSEKRATTPGAQIIVRGANGQPQYGYADTFDLTTRYDQAPDANTTLTQTTSRLNNRDTNATSRANNRDTNATSRANAQLSANRSAGAGGMTAAQRANVQNKLQAVQLVQAQLRRAQEAFKIIRNSALQAGPGTQFNPLANGGQRFDAIARGLQQTIRQLTRTPGEGAMSDYESRLAAAIVPDRADLEGVTAARLEELQNIVDDIEAGYTNMSMPNPGGATGGWGEATVEGE